MVTERSDLRFLTQLWMVWFRNLQTAKLHSVLRFYLSNREIKNDISKLNKKREKENCLFVSSLVMVTSSFFSLPEFSLKSYLDLCQDF